MLLLYSRKQTASSKFGEMSFSYKYFFSFDPRLMPQRLPKLTGGQPQTFGGFEIPPSPPPPVLSLWGSKEKNLLITVWN